MGKKVEIQEGALSSVLAARTDALRQAIEGTLGAYVKWKACCAGVTNIDCFSLWRTRLEKGS